jgi:hypothetical protein
MAIEDFEDFLAELKTWPNLYEEVDDETTWGTSMFASLFFETPDTTTAIRQRRAVIDCLGEYQDYLPDSLTYALHPDTERWHPLKSTTLPDLSQFIENYSFEESFVTAASSEKNPASSPKYAVKCLVPAVWSEHPPTFERNYGYIRMDFTRTWWRTRRAAFLAMYLKIAKRLGAEQGYIGFGWALPSDIGAQMAPESTEFELARRLYGFDIEKPFWMCDPHSSGKGLIHGLRSPSWATFVGGRFLEQLGGIGELRKCLQRPDIALHETEGGVLIEAGPEPDLYPVENGIPPVMMAIAKVLKPARAKTLQLTGFQRYDDDPEVTFDLNTAAQWLARFDEDGVWPSPEVRFVAPDAGPVANSGPIESKSVEHRAIDNDLLVAHNGQACPKSGTWGLKDRLDVKRTFELGDILPSFENREAVWVFLSQ